MPSAPPPTKSSRSLSSAQRRVERRRISTKRLRVEDTVVMKEISRFKITYVFSPDERDSSRVGAAEAVVQGTPVGVSVSLPGRREWAGCSCVRV